MKRPNLRAQWALLLVVTGLLASASAAEPSVKLLNSQHGPATVEGEDTPYYYFKSKIEMPAGKSLEFRQDTCVLVGKDGTRRTDYWIHLAGWSAGLEETKTAPVSMKTLFVREESGKAKPASKWNTTKPDGPKAAITYSVPKEGFIELYLLWPVPKGFQSKRVILTGLVELDL